MLEYCTEHMVENTTEWNFMHGEVVVWLISFMLLEAVLNSQEL